MTQTQTEFPCSFAEKPTFDQLINSTRANGSGTPHILGINIEEYVLLTNLTILTLQVLTPNQLILAGILHGNPPDQISIMDFNLSTNKGTIKHNVPIP